MKMLVAEPMGLCANEQTSLRSGSAPVSGALHRPLHRAVQEPAIGGIAEGFRGVATGGIEHAARADAAPPCDRVIRAHGDALEEELARLVAALVHGREHGQARGAARGLFER